MQQRMISAEQLLLHVSDKASPENGHVTCHSVYHGYGPFDFLVCFV